MHRPRFYSNYTASFDAYSIIFRASALLDSSKNNVFMHLAANATAGLCSLSQLRDTIYYCNTPVLHNVSVGADPTFDFALVFDGNRVAAVFFNGIVEPSGAEIPSARATKVALHLGRSVDDSTESSLDGSLVYLMILNRAVSGAEVQNLIRWSDNVHTVGAAYRHFAFGTWSSFSFTSMNQHDYNVVWRYPASAHPAFARTLSFLLLLPHGTSSRRNLLMFSAPGIFYSRRFGIDWIRNSSEFSQIYIYAANDSFNVSGSMCMVPASGSIKIDVVVSPNVSGTGSNFIVYINQVLQSACGFSTAWSSALYGGDILTRQSNGTEVGMDAQFQHVQVLSYAASHFEVTKPRLLSIAVSNVSSRLSSATVNGCCFTRGIPCSLLAGGVTVSVTCAVISAVQAHVTMHPNAQVGSAALIHGSQVFVMEELQTSDAV